MRFVEKAFWACWALVMVCTLGSLAHATAYPDQDVNGAGAPIPAGRAPATYVAPAPPVPLQGSTVTLNGSVETIFTGASGRCYLVNTNGKDIYFYGEDATHSTSAAVTDHRLPDPGIEKVCLLTGNTKIHFFASAATTATVAQTGP